ncbi:uncharacterized protein LOC111065036 [Drosophila obscura]|uniref:uncharacterized protein LOC111065036 n=1 Tax=Drosophila obscura TaxID=7282 RepID=UPI000BA13874|nr:uncharacterized protein LOC111065036 [Drosophila obscura]
MRTAKQSQQAAKKQPQPQPQKPQPSYVGKAVAVAASRNKGLLQQQQQQQAAVVAVGSDEGAGDGPSKDRLVSLRFHDISLLHTDVRLLQERRGGMNERLVAFYFAYLQNRRYKAQSQVYFMQPSLARSLRQTSQRLLKRQMRERGLHERKFILLPMCSEPGAFHVAHEHWSLLFIARPERKLYYYDSLDNSHRQLAGALHQCLSAPLALTEFSLVVGRCLQQAHNEEHQSGIHVMCMADHVADYVLRCGYASSSLLIARDEVQGMRTAVLQLIQCMGGILPSSRKQSSSEG